MSTESHIAPVPIAGEKPKSALIAFGDQGIVPRTMEEAFILAKAILNSGLAPKDCKSPESVLIRIQFGAELGLSPMMSLQSVADINGRASIFGDAGKALLRARGFDIEEADIDDIRRTGVARCMVTHPRQKPVTRTYSIEDAKKAGLWGKQGPWSTNPYRQLAWRAFWFAGRDAAADVLKGIGGAEEVRDTPQTERNVTETGLAASLDAIDAPNRTESAKEGPSCEQSGPATDVHAEEPAKKPFEGDEQTRADLAASREREGA